MNEQAAASQPGAAGFLEMLQDEAYRKWRVEPPANVAGLTGYGIGQFEAVFAQLRQMADYADLAAPDDVLERLRRADEAAARGEHIHVFDDLNAPTKYENPIIHHSITIASTQIYEVARNLNCPIPRQPLIGTMPTGDIHAFTVSVPEELQTGASDPDNLIVFDWQFFLFVHLFSKCLARALPTMPSTEHGPGFVGLSWKDKDFRRNIDRNPAVAEAFTDLLVSYATTGRPGTSRSFASAEAFQQNQLGHGHKEMAGIIRTSMELFVIGHEYGHIAQWNMMAADGGEGHGLRWLAYDGDDPDNPVVRQQMAELDADGYGLRLACLAARPKYRELALEYVGADAYFSGVDLMRRALSVLVHGRVVDAAPTTHPRAKYRRALLRGSLSTFPVSGKERKGAIGLAEKVELIAELLWERAYDTLMDLHRKGTRPAPWWLEK